MRGQKYDSVRFVSCLSKSGKQILRVPWSLKAPWVSFRTQQDLALYMFVCTEFTINIRFL